ncbi:MAG: hypothetical protein ACR2FZ_05995 [Thermoleophilaceae bacterium]
MGVDWAMVGKVARQEQLLKNVIRLRRAERIPAVAADVAGVRADLEDEVGPTVSRALAARLLAVSQTALDRWISLGEVPTVIAASGRREVPRHFVVELAESIEDLEYQGVRRHRLGAALRERGADRDALTGVPPLEAGAGRSGSGAPDDHRTAERRGLAYHRAVADRLDMRLIDQARERLDRWRRANTIHPSYASRWEELLSLPPAEVARLITSDSADACDMRQSSPFAGALHEDERRRIIETIR